VSLDHPVIAVIGAGAVGGYYGARLIQHGHHVHLLTQSDWESIRRSGMKIQSPDGDFSLGAEQVKAHADPREMPKADLVIVTLKTTANDRLADLVGPVLKEDSIILTLQNGLGNEDLLGNLFGADRILGGMAFVCINRTGPGEISHTDHGIIRLGELHGGLSERAQKIADLFGQSKVPCNVLENLTRGRWDKLIWNVPFNGLGAVLDMTTDQLIGSDEGLTLVRKLCEEVIATCKPLNILFDLNIIEEKIRHTRTMGAYKTSMQVDRQKRRPMEIEAIIGRPLQIARQNAITTPYLAMLHSMLSLINAQNIAM